ncbi:DoxX family protein [Halococcus saccharolyticus]|nr:DoxX family protein [Halococcus saccharolyticus]
MGRLSTLGRALFGGVLAFTAIDNLRDIDGMAAYAESNGVPAADRLVPLSSGMLLAGSLGVVLGRAPRLSAGAIAAFLVGVTPTMHDFWNREEAEREQQVIHFLKNTALLGGALFFLSRGPADE